MFFSLPVLMYHSISEHPHPLCVHPTVFIEHCTALTKRGWHGITLEEAEGYFLRKKRLPKKTCLITFDDGYLDNYVEAEPILRQFGHHGVMFPIASLLETEPVLRPNREALNALPELQKNLPPIHQRPTAIRSNVHTPGITFCSWAEALHMHRHGNMAMAPHSMRHDRVMAGLHIHGFNAPDSQATFFDVPPYFMPFGFPLFDIKHAMAHRAYTPVPELFELVERMVPQNPEEATLFLKDPQQRKNLVAALRKLPVLAVQESEAQYRKRIAEDFHQCMQTFTEKLGYAPVSYCWPWGSYTPTALREARKAGFRIFFTTRRGANFFGNALAVRRLTVRQCQGGVLLERMDMSCNPFKEVPYGWLGDWSKTEQGQRLILRCKQKHPRLAKKLRIK